MDSGPVDGLRFEGRDWPVEGFTMIGMLRLDHLQACVEDVLARGVPRDFIEAGVWRGGASMFMRVLLRLHGIEDRAVHVLERCKLDPPAGVRHRRAGLGGGESRQAELEEAQVLIALAFVLRGLRSLPRLPSRFAVQ